MKACVIHGPRDLRIEEWDEPQAGRDEVVVRLAAGGICGSDQHYFVHARCGDFAIREPFVPGHEVAGFVARTGRDVRGLDLGALVAINPSLPCGICESCRGGHRNLCRNNGFRGSASRFPHAQGMLSERFVVKSFQCVPVAGGIVPAALAFAEPLSVALHAVERAGSVDGKRVLVTGGRTIGLLIGLVCRMRGAHTLAVTDRAEHALGVARRCGADLAVATGDAAARGGFLDGNRDSFDVAFEASGSEAALADAIALVRPGGTLVQVGTLPPLTGRAPINLVMVKELDFLGAFRFDAEFPEAVRILTVGALDVGPLLTRTFPLPEAEAAFRMALDAGVSTKVQITGEGA